jgi:hypothetical protein
VTEREPAADSIAPFGAIHSLYIELISFSTRSSTLRYGSLQSTVRWA